MVDIARVRTVFTGVAGSPYYSNLYFQEVTSTAEAQACVDAVDVFWTSLATVMNISLVGAIEAEVPIIEAETGQIQAVFATTGGVVDPTSAGEPLPWATQGLIRLATNGFVDGRRVRGRINVPGLGESSSDAGAPNAAIIASMQAAITGLITDGSTTLVVWSRPRLEEDPPNPDKPPRDGSAQLVSSGSVWAKWAQLRSRRD